MIWVHDVIHYNIVLYGLKVKDFGKLAEFIPQAIRETLLSEGVNPELIDDFDDERDEPVVLEQTTLEEYLPKYKRALYHYDFGDGWEHLIEVQNILFDYDKYYAHCVAGEGGYEDFMEIMADPKHPEYAEMKEWVTEQYWHRQFELEAINRELKYSF